MSDALEGSHIYLWDMQLIILLYFFVYAKPQILKAMDLTRWSWSGIIQRMAVQTGWLGEYTTNLLSQ
jgi:hypothetical protein